MAPWLVYCSMQIVFNVRAQLVVLLIVACWWALRNKTELDFYIICSKHLCQSVFACSNSVSPIFFPTLGCCICLHAWANVSVQINICADTVCRYAYVLSVCFSMFLSYFRSDLANQKPGRRMSEQEIELLVIWTKRGRCLEQMGDRDMTKQCEEREENRMTELKTEHRRADSLLLLMSPIFCLLFYSGWLNLLCNVHSPSRTLLLILVGLNLCNVQSPIMKWNTDDINFLMDLCCRERQESMLSFVQYLSTTSSPSV